MEQIKAGDRVIGSVEYVDRYDHWRAESIHQLKPVVFYTVGRAKSWVRRLHTEETAG